MFWIERTPCVKYGYQIKDYARCHDKRDLLGTYLKSKSRPPEERLVLLSSYQHNMDSYMEEKKTNSIEVVE